MNNHTKSKKVATKKGNKVIVSDNISSDTRNAFLQFNSWRIVPLTADGAERLAMKLFEWCTTNDDVLCFDEFLVQHRLSFNTYYKWLDKFPVLKEMHTWALMFLGARREKGALKNQLNPLVVKFTMPYYSPEMKKLVEFYAAVKKPEDEILAASRIIVNMSKFPESDVVPKKVEDVQLPT